LVVLAAAQRHRPTAKPADLLFPSLDAEPLDINAMRQAMQRALDRNVTPHGIRATFRTWARDTGRDETLAELALAHAVDDETNAAYARSNAFDRRVTLLEEWCETICGDRPGNVVPLVAR
jgi:integrase